MPPEIPFDPSFGKGFVATDLTPEGARRHVYEERIKPETHKLLTFSPDDYVGSVIGTQSRIGCESVGIWRIDPTGRDEIFMSHYQYPESTWAAIEQAAPHGEGRIKAVYLTPRQENNDMVQETSRIVQRVTGIQPDIITVPIPADMRSLQEQFEIKSFQSQIVALRRFPTIATRRIIIPGTTYDSNF